MTETELRRFLHAAFDMSEPSATELRAWLVLSPSRSRLREGVLALGAALAIGLVVTVVVATMLAGARLAHRTEPAETPTRSPGPSFSQRSHFVSLGQAKADSPDPIWGAGWLPFVATAPQVQEIDSTRGGAEVTILYYRERSGQHSVLITELHAATTDFQPVGPTKPTTINGLPAIFSQISSDGTADAVAWMLPNGHYITVQGTGLSEPDLVHVAEALRVQ